MKIRNITMIAAFVGILGAVSVKAQSNGIGGLTVGLNSTSIEVSNRFLGIENDLHGENLLGFSVGVFGQFWSGPVLFRPEFNYQFNAGTIEIWGEYSDFRLHKLGMPLLVGLNLVGPLCIEAGPSFEYVLLATRDFNNAVVDLAKLGMGYKVGPSLQFEQWFANFHFMGAAYFGGDGSGRASFYEPFKIGASVGIKIE